MSLPPASAPVAVLVLVWDETIPAVRALVEATEPAEPALDSIGVLVPAGPATAELTQEEFLPLAENSLPTETLLGADLGNFMPLAVPATMETTAPAPTSTPSCVPADEPEELPELPTAAPTVPTLASQGIPLATAPGWPAVRVMQPGGYSLAALTSYAPPTLVWAGAATLPAAPYMGSTVPALGPVAVALGPVATVADFALAFAPALSASRPTPAEIIELPYAPTEPPAAPDAETDTMPALSPPTFVSNTDTSTTELREEVSDELATNSSTEEAAPALAAWSEGLASLPAPTAFTAVDSPAAEAATPAISLALPAPALLAAPESAPSQSALLPITQSFDAPNLNFQIIQYARFAVPLALADEPFAVIYAPAWPTWLAAQELRYRTGWPLVLHVATLAADTEPLDLAAGWPAEIQRQALHRADLILTETPVLAHRLRRELNLPTHRVRPVPAADAAAVAQALSTVSAIARQ